jgi:hypothetical protein
VGKINRRLFRFRLILPLPFKILSFLNSASSLKAVNIPMQIFSSIKIANLQFIYIFLLWDCHGASLTHVMHKKGGRILKNADFALFCVTVNHS